MMTQNIKTEYATRLASNNLLIITIKAKTQNISTELESLRKTMTKPMAYKRKVIQLYFWLNTASNTSVAVN